MEWYNYVLAVYVVLKMIVSFHFLSYTKAFDRCIVSYALNKAPVIL